MRGSGTRGRAARAGRLRRGANTAERGRGLAAPCVSGAGVSMCVGVPFGAFWCISIRFRERDRRGGAGGHGLIIFATPKISALGTSFCPELRLFTESHSYMVKRITTAQKQTETPRDMCR